MAQSGFFATGKASKGALAALALLPAFGSVAQESGVGKDGPAADPGALGQAVALTRVVREQPSGLNEYRLYYDQALADRQYLEAEAAAKQMVDFMNERGDGDDRDMADALSRLAVAQRFSERYDSALQNYEAAIRILESSENRLSDQLVEPLRGIGDTYVASGSPALALPVYQHAVHITHVNEGPHNLDQVDILDSMVNAEMLSGDADAALDLTDRMYALYARAFAGDGEEVLPVLQRKAELLNDLGRHQQERMVYREIVRIIEDHRGEADLSLYETYTALGRTYFHDLDEVIFRSEPTTETGETFLKKALEIAEENPGATWLMREQALIELGDYYTVRDVQDKARMQYRRAWELTSRAGHLDQRKRDLEQVIPLVQSKLDPSANFGYRSDHEEIDPADYKNGYVVARFTVNDRGRVTDTEVVDADPAGFAAMETRVRNALQDFIYRPRYEDGQPTRMPAQTFRHEFLYLDRDLEGN
ncbi:MAG: tetratricopeptide repeat protein [Woeseiaceae bacterium]